MLLEKIIGYTYLNGHISWNQQSVVSHMYMYTAHLYIDY